MELKPHNKTCQNNVSEFDNVIRQILNDIRNPSSGKYATVDSLQNIVLRLAELNPHDKTIYAEHIDHIKKTIREFGAGGGCKRLTCKQCDRVEECLDQALHLMRPRVNVSKKYKKHKSYVSPSLLNEASSLKIPAISDEPSSSNNDSPALSDRWQSIEPIMNAGDYVDFSERNPRWEDRNGTINFGPAGPKYNDSLGIVYPLQTILDDEIMGPIVFNLLENMSRNVMGSTLNRYVLEYMEMSAGILIQEPEKYDGVCRNIFQCLERFGWTDQGFYTDPDRIGIVNELQNIYNAYF